MPEEEFERAEANKQTEIEPNAEATMRTAAQRRAEAALREEQKRANLKHDPFLRAVNEDDDGYDPYSDRIEQANPWEEDPWR